MNQSAETPSENNEAPQSERERIPPSLWREYEGSEVMVQFREGLQYMAVTYPNELVVRCEVEGPEGQKAMVNAPASMAAREGVKGAILSTGFMQGTLRIKQDREATMLQLEFPDVLEQVPPGERPRRKVKALFPPDYVGFMSVVEQSLIQR